MSQIAQLSKSRHQRSISAPVSAAGSPTNDTSIRASYQPVSHSARASAWLRPSRVASPFIVLIDTPNAFSAWMA